MAYCIRYSAPQKKERQVRKAPAIIALLLAILLLTAYFWQPAGIHRVTQALIPPQVQKTGQALEAMARELETGEDFSQAVEAFCRDLKELDESA